MLVTSLSLFPTLPSKTNSFISATCKLLAGNIFDSAISSFLSPLEEKAFENIVGKGENAGYKHFLLFPQCFLLFPTQISSFESRLFRRLKMLCICTSLKFCRLVKR